MNTQQTPFGLLFAHIDMRTQNYTPLTKVVSYNACTQQSDLGIYSMDESSCMGGTTTHTDSTGKAIGGDDDACRDD